MLKNKTQNKILKTIARKKAISVKDLSIDSSNKYAVNRSIKNIIDTGLAEVIPSNQADYLRITNLGKQKLYSEELSSGTMPIEKSWDGKWRIIILDLSEERKNERESLRYLLKKAGFVCVKNSVWISPLPFEHFFSNIKKDFGFTTELMIITTDSIDEATKETFLEIFKN